MQQQVEGLRGSRWDLEPQLLEQSEELGRGFGRSWRQWLHDAGKMEMSAHW